MTDALARTLPQGYRGIYLPRVRGGMWFRYRHGILVSEREYTIRMTLGTAGYSADNAYFAPIPHDYKMWLTAIDWALYVSATAVWVMTLRRSLWDESSYPDVLNSAGVAVARSTSGQAAGSAYGYTDLIDSMVDGTGDNSGTNTQGLMLNIDEQTGTATCRPTVSVRYRLIAP